MHPFIPMFAGEIADWTTSNTWCAKGLECHGHGLHCRGTTWVRTQKKRSPKIPNPQGRLPYLIHLNTMIECKSWSVTRQKNGDGTFTTFMYLTMRSALAVEPRCRRPGSWRGFHPKCSRGPWVQELRLKVRPPNSSFFRLLGALGQAFFGHVQMRPQNYPSVHGGHGKPSAVHHARHVAVLSAVQSHPQPTHVFIHLVMVQHQNGGKQIHHGWLALYIYMLQDDIHIHTCYESKTYWLINIL